MSDSYFAEQLKIMDGLIGQCVSKKFEEGRIRDLISKWNIASFEIIPADVQREHIKDLIKRMGGRP